jgi:hypothetical protein
MQRIYEQRWFLLRSNVSMVILVAVVVYGVFELWRAFTAEVNDPTGMTFGFLFVAGGIYAYTSVWTDWRDVAAAIDVDEGGRRLEATLWRPFRPLILDRPASDFTNWRHWVKVGKRSARLHFLMVDVAGYPRPLAIEMPLGKPVSEGLRKLAPEAVEDFEINSGAKRDSASAE